MSDSKLRARSFGCGAVLLTTGENIHRVIETALVYGVTVRNITEDRNADRNHI